MARRGLALVGLLIIAAAVSISAQYGAKNGEWRSYAGEPGSTKYSPLDQINKDNAKNLRIAWRFKTDSLGPRPEYKLEGTPLAINGVLYTTGGTRRSVVALDGKTGELIWAHSLREGIRAGVSPRQLSGRGVSYWTDGRGDERVVYVTTGYRLVELNAKTGALVSSFGNNGIVNTKTPEVMHTGMDVPYSHLSSPTIFKNLIITGAGTGEGPGGSNGGSGPAGDTRAWDATTGKLVWTFHTVPRPGEFGYDSWGE